MRSTPRSRRGSRSPSSIPRRATSAAAATWSSAWPTAGPRRSTIARSRRSPRRATCTSTERQAHRQERRRTARVAACRAPSPVSPRRWRKYGTMSLTDVMAPAIRLAEQGFVVDSALARAVRATYAQLIAQFNGAARLPARRQAAARGGTRSMQPDARAARCAPSRDAGRAGVLRGRDRRRVVADELKRDGGIITRRISRATQPVWRTPIRSTYRGYTLLTMPPSSSGGVTMTETLNILEGFRLAAAVRQHASTRTSLGSAYQRAFVDRNEKLGDPAFVKVPIDAAHRQGVRGASCARRSARRARRRRRR